MFISIVGWTASCPSKALGLSAEDVCLPQVQEDEGPGLRGSVQAPARPQWGHGAA